MIIVARYPEKWENTSPCAKLPTGRTSGAEIGSEIEQYFYCYLPWQNIDSDVQDNTQLSEHTFWEKNVKVLNIQVLMYVFSVIYLETMCVRFMLR